MPKFRLPRKTKKKLRDSFFLYPEVNGGSVMASPYRNQEDYNAYKKGVLRDLFHATKAEQKKSAEEWNRKFATPIEISDIELLEAVNDIFAEQYRMESYTILVRAKHHPIAKKDYYTFVNAWILIKKGEKHENTACLSIYGAKSNLQRKERKNKEK